ncbi:putative collagen-binding protein [Sanguibacter keddieii DSM 10542]|uniref:alpha-amylase n=1 Tax=Sanguibacter keddieii (strain ATCC 51767 / DSM 10542 / NCFB 3025 / ST-74) TaxID=446469 RepID=D1BKU1_SANKS|nr:carboxypeptidase regulatory-like domain-containing protein [Sanguibacter keddieii]ACZ22568.1 putative collagen-binding protein [Sanguibacter keddieii DSM 10542]
MTEQITPTPAVGLGAPSVLVEPGAHAPAGRAATLRVHARNLADGPRDVTVTVMGLDDGWSPEPVRLPAVEPDATVSTEIDLLPVVGAVPGDYPFVVVVQSAAPGAGPTTTLAESVLVVDAPSEVLLTVEPADSRMRMRRRLSVVLSNTGVEPVELTVKTQTSRGLRLELPSRTLTVPGRQTVRMSATARNQRPQLMGHLDRRTFSVVAQGRQAPARFSGTVTARPLVSAAMMRVVGLLMVVVLWGGGLLVALPWFTDRAGDQPVTAQPAATVVTDPAAGPDGSGGTEGAAGGSGADGSGAPGEDDGVLPDAGVRVGGVVTADDPSGVRVQIAPASIIPTTTQQTAAGTPAASGGGGGAARGAGTSRVVPAAVVAGTGTSGTLASSDDATSSSGSARAITKTSALGLPLGSTSAAGQSSTVSAARSTETGSDGAWAFAGLAPTLNYLVTVSKPGYQTVRQVVSGAEAAAAALDVTLVAGDGSLSGVVTGPDGAGAGGVTVVLSDGTTTVSTTTATSGTVGSWAVDGLSTPSTYLVTAQGAGLGAQSVLVTLSAGGSATAPLSLQDGVATLSGTVTGPDALGAVSGVGGATVTATAGDTTRTASTLTSGRPGAYSLADLPVPGSYTLTVEAPGFATQTLELDLGPESSAAPADVLLGSSSGVAQGTVRDTAGTALSGAGLSLTNGTDAYKTMSTSDGSGSFRFNGIVPGEYVLSAELFGHLTASTTVTVASGGTVGADLVLTPVAGDGLVDTSRIRGRASDARTNGQIDCVALAPGEECLVTVSLTAQNPDGTQRQVTVTSEPDLEYVIPAADDTGLLPGLYELTVSAPGYESSSVKVNVPMAQTVSAGQVALFPSPSLSGTVLTRIGAVPDGTCVVAVASGQPAPTGGCTAPAPDTCQVDGGRCAFTGVNGGYTITSMPAGTYTVTVLPGSAEYRVSGTIPPVTLVPGDVRRVDVTLDRLARLSVTTLVDRGTGAITPAAGAVVTPVLLAGSGKPVVPGAPGTPGTPVVSVDGVAALSMLEPGTYRFDVTWQDDDGVQLTGSIAGIELAFNQERTTQLVLTRTVRVFQGALMTQLTAGIQTPVEDREVVVTGIIGYDGVTPVRSSVTLVTDDDGQFATSATPDTSGYLPLVSDKVDVTVAARTEAPFDYKALSLTGVDFVSGTSTIIELQPVGQPFSGTLTLAGDGPDARAPASQVLFEVVSGPPGASSVSISAVTTASGTSFPLLWRDANQPASGAGTLARPGTYVVRATLAGHEPVQETIDVVVETGNAPVTFKLARFGSLTVAPVTCSEPLTVPPCGDVGTTPVPRAEITVSGNGIQQTATLAQGTPEAEFGELPSGDYRVVVRAAGMARLTTTLTVKAEDTDAQPVFLTRLGTIRGTVWSTTARAGDPDGTRPVLRKLPGAVVTATGPGGAEFTVVTDADGAYSITGTAALEGLQTGRWSVQARLDGYTAPPAQTVDVTGPGTFEKDVTMPFTPVTVTVFVVNDLIDGEAVPGLDVVLQDGIRSVPATCPPVATGSATTTCDRGEYRFPDVLPVQSILSISGAGYRSLQVSITPPVGQPNSAVTVPLVANTNAIGGIVTGQRGSGTPVPLKDETVRLTAVPAAPTDPDAPVDPPVTSDTMTGVDGSFLFRDLTDGAYDISVEAAGYSPVTRRVTVVGGQAALVDLRLFQVTRAVTVSVTSGSDLTGTLVSLTAQDGTTLPGTIAGQPLVRSGATYTTIFNQVPEGAWTATFTGASGHPWSTTRVLDAGDTTLEATIDEVRLRLAATGPDSGAQLTVTVEGSPSDTDGAIVDLTRTVSVGASAETLYLLAGTYELTPSTVAGATVSPATVTIAPSESDRLVTFAVQSPSTTTLPALTDWEIGTAKTLVATVRGPQSSAATATGTVTFSLAGTELDVVAVDAAGRATLSGTLPAGTVPGATEVTAVYSGSTSLAGSQASRTVTVTAAGTTTTLAAPGPLTVGTPTTLSATVSAPSGGTVTGSVEFLRGGDVVATGTLAGGTATASFTPTSAGPATLSARFVASGSYAASTSAGRSVTAARGPSTTTATAPAAVGGDVTARVAWGGAPATAGTVEVSSPGGQVSCPAVSLTDGVASCSTAGLPAGTHTITVVYSGTVDRLGSQTTVQVVVPAAPPEPGETEDPDDGTP